MSRPLYTCPRCGLTFDEERWARECDAWCRTNGSCSLAITVRARERQPKLSEAQASQARSSGAGEEEMY